MPPLRVSINGPDNVGKSTQIRLLKNNLAEECYSAGGIHLYHSTWPGLPAKEFSKWWFVDSPTEELTTLIFESYISRATTIDRSNCRVAMLDRGLLTIEAVCVATSVIKDKCDYETAAETVSTIRKRLLDGNNTEDVKILLMHSDNLIQSVEASLAREEQEIESTYRDYQCIFQSILLKQAQDHKYDVVINCAGKSIIEIQNEIRSLLKERGIEVSPSCVHFERVYAFGGMSESGKSTSADYLRTKYGVTRLKIHYLIETAAKIRDIPDVYSQPEYILAELILEELDRLARRQYYLREYSIESLHRLEMTKQLKRLLGCKLVICYCNASQEKRRARVNESSDELHRRDDVKVNRGADQIKSIADFVINNDFDLVCLYKQLDSVYSTCSMERFFPTVRGLETLNTPDDLRNIAHQVLSEVIQEIGANLKLFAIIGSVGLQRAQENWSDLDILIIVAPQSAVPLRRVIKNTQHLFSIKVGLTILTPMEIAYLRVESKVIHVLSLLKSGRLGVQYIARDYTLPCVSLSEDIDSSLNYLPTALHTLRREVITPHPNTRRLYKLIILCSKIVIRTNRILCEDENSIIQTLNALYPDTIHLSIPAIETVLADQVNPSKIVEIGCAFLNWFETFLAEPVS